MAGSNRSGDLHDAQRSIPLGTVCAVLLTSSLYLLCVLSYGGVAERGTLTGAALFTAEVALPPPVVQAGITLSTLGAGLQSLTGAPRLLQAIANDNLIPALHWFRGAGEPRRALLCTFCICINVWRLGFSINFHKKNIVSWLISFHYFCTVLFAYKLKIV